MDFMFLLFWLFERKIMIYVTSLKMSLNLMHNVGFFYCLHQFYLNNRNFGVCIPCTYKNETGNMQKKNLYKFHNYK